MSLHSDGYVDRTKMTMRPGESCLDHVQMLIGLRQLGLNVGGELNSHSVYMSVLQALIFLRTLTIYIFILFLELFVLLSFVLQLAGNTIPCHS